MEYLMILTGALLLFIAFPTSIIITIVFAVKKRNIKVPLICIFVSFVLSLYILVGVFAFYPTEETAKNENQKEDMQNSEQPKPIENIESEEKGENAIGDKKDFVIRFETGEIYNDNNIVILVDSENASKLKLEVQNNSENDYDFYVSAISINGVMANGYDGAARTNVPSLKKGEMCVEFTSELKKEARTMEYVDINICAQENSGEFGRIETGILRIRTNNYNAENTFEPNGKFKELNGLLILQNPINQNKISYSIINKNEYIVKTTLQNCSVNEWAFEPGYSSFESGDLIGVKIDGFDITVFPNSMSTVYVDLEEFLKEHSIDKVEEFSFSLNIVQYADYLKSENTEKIIFSY